MGRGMVGVIRALGRGMVGVIRALGRGWVRVVRTLGWVGFGVSSGLRIIY